MPYSEQDVRALLGERGARLVEAEDIPYSTEQVALGAFAVADEFQSWLDRGAPGAPLFVRSESLRRLSIELHRYPRVDVLEVMDRAGRRMSLRAVRGAPDVGLVGAAGNLAYVRYNRDGDACAIAVGEHTILLGREDDQLRVALVRGQQQTPHPARESLLQWNAEGSNVVLQERVAQLVQSGAAWDAIVAAALLSHLSGPRSTVRRLRSFEDLRAMHLVEARPVEWIRSLSESLLHVLEDEVLRRLRELRTALVALGRRDDELSNEWRHEYSRRAWERAAVEVVAWLIRQHPASNTTLLPWEEVDHAGEAVRPVLEELLSRDRIVDAVTAIDPGTWWGAGSIDDAVE